MADDPTDIRNFQRLDPRTTTSGRLRDEDLPALALLIRQWDPSASDRKEARPWAEFLGRTGI